MTGRLRARGQGKYPYRIQVRLDEDAWAALCAYRERHDLSLSAAVRAVCRGGAHRPQATISRNRAGLPPAPAPEFAPLPYCHRRHNPRDRKFYFFLRGPRDIGVYLDADAWAGLTIYMQRHNLILAEAVRELLTRSARYLPIGVGGPRHRMYEDDDD